MSIAATTQYHAGCGGILSKQTIICARCGKAAVRGEQMTSKRGGE